ncbi:MAG: SDR family NAD(P)-dependent oxidoreductase [Sphingomonadaceae bacterium]|nr:SDR family NAD(P)-dependent oxidoreductase [Sphingomonadaceae bacterium]
MTNPAANMPTLLIIGSGPGLAQAIARRFGRDGWRTVLAARNAERLDARVAALREDGIEAVAQSADAADPAALQRLVDGVRDRFGAIDLLVYNAATIRWASLLEQPAEEIDADLMVGVGGAIAAAQAAARHMIARGHGTILFTGGGLALDPWPGFVTLSAAKAALRAVSVAQRKDPALAAIRFGHIIIHGGINETTAPGIADRYAELYRASAGEWVPEIELHV